MACLGVWTVGRRCSRDPKWSFGCGWRSHIFSHSDFSRSRKTWLRRKRKNKGWDRNRWHILSQRHAMSQVCEAYSQVPRSHKSRLPKLRKWIFADEFLQLELHLYGFIITDIACLESTLSSQGGPARSDQIVRTGAEGKQQGLPLSCDVELLGLMIGIDLDMGGNCRSLMTGKQMTRAYSLPWRTNRPLDNNWLFCIILPSCQFVLFKSRVPEYEKYEKKHEKLLKFLQCS